MTKRSDLVEYAERIKENKRKQNEKQQQNFDRVSVVLPKGTKAKITEAGFTLNGFIVQAVLEKLNNIDTESKGE